MFLATKSIQHTLSHRNFLKRFCSLDRLFSRVDEYHHLVSFLHKLDNFVECHTVEILPKRGAVRFAPDTYEVLFEWYRAE